MMNSCYAIVKHVKTSLSCLQHRRTCTVEKLAEMPSKAMKLNTSTMSEDLCFVAPKAQLFNILFPLPQSGEIMQCGNVKNFQV